MRFCSSHGGGKVAEVFEAIIVASFDTPDEKGFRVINGIAAGGREAETAESEERDVGGTQWAMWECGQWEYFSFLR